MMRTLTPLGLLLAAALAAPASATPVQVAEGALVDVSSDGRFVLLDDGRVIDRRGDAGLPGSTATPLALADRAAVVLERTAGGQLQVRRRDAPPEFVNVGPDGFAVPAGPARLVRNGQAVIFQTTQSPVRIIERDLTTDTSTVRAEGRSLLDASEDGRVITWIRQVPAAVPPPGRIVAPGAPSGPTAVGTAVGYVVDDQAPRVARVSTWKQEQAVGQDGVTCPNTILSRTSPKDLLISQRGSANADSTYVLAVTQRKQVAVQPPAPDFDLTERLNAAGAIQQSQDEFQTELKLDPVSAALGQAIDFPDDPPNTPPSQQNVDFGLISDGYGRGGVIDIDATVGTVRRVLPYADGAGAAVTVRAPDGALSVWADDVAVAVTDPPKGFWSTLPRAGDPLDSPSLTVDAGWYFCDQLVPASASNYLQLNFPVPTWRSLGTVTTQLTPAGSKPAKRATFNIRWGYPAGPILWSKTVTANTTFRLPPNPLNFTNFVYERIITFADGTRTTDRGIFPLVNR